MSGGQRVSVRTQRAAPTVPQQLRDGDPVPVGTTDPVQQRLTIGETGTVGTSEPVETVTDGGTPTRADGPAIKRIHADADGPDGENLNDEYLVFTNTDMEPLDLSGDTITDAADHSYAVPEGVTLDPGAELTLHTGSGTDTETDLYWGSGSPIWNNGGDTITVRAPDGTVILEEPYE